MIDTYHLDDLRQRIDLRDFMRQHRPLSTSKHLSANRRQIALPCPRCGGTDRFCVSSDMWLCRQCAPPETGKRRDLFELIQFMGLAADFPGAVEYAARYVGDTAVADQIDRERKQREERAYSRMAIAVERQNAATLPYQAKAVAVPATPTRRTVTPEWIAAHVATAASRLDGGPGDAYLANRGLSAATMRVYRLGYQGDVKLPGADAKHPAITIPWLSPDGKQVQRLGYRYLTTHTYIDKDGRSQECKYKIMSALQFQPDALFGAHLLSQSPTLIITEGELNACSVYQESTADVVSFGSQTIHQRQLERLAALAQGYQHVIVWADEPQNATQIATALSGHGNVTPIRSPRGLDANDLLQRGLLAAFLTKLTGHNDLTAYIGQTLGGAAWAALRLECQRRGWTVEGTHDGEGWHVDRLTVKPQEN